METKPQLLAADVTAIDSYKPLMDFIAELPKEITSFNGAINLPNIISIGNKLKKTYEQDRKKYTSQLDAVWTALMAPENACKDRLEELKKQAKSLIQDFIDANMPDDTSDYQLKKVFGSYSYIKLKRVYVIEKAGHIPVHLLSLNEKDLIEYLKEGNALPEGITSYLIPTPSL